MRTFCCDSIVMEDAALDHTSLDLPPAALTNDLEAPLKSDMMTSTQLASLQSCFGIQLNILARH